MLHFATLRGRADLLLKLFGSIQLYSFEPKYLDPDAELRRMFGSKVVSLRRKEWSQKHAT